MTAKRFIFHSTEIEDTWETDANYKYTSCNKDGFQDLCELLNEQHETIQRLKQNIDELLSVTVEEELLKENEQLKQQINELKEDVPLLLAFYRWYPFAVEKKEHQSYNRLWDFVND